VLNVKSACIGIHQLLENPNILAETSTFSTSSDELLYHTFQI